jgi:hypothetical protein
MSPEERQDWEASDRTLREVVKELDYLRNAVKELQDAQTS